MADKPLWDWEGPFGGLPPYDRASPDRIERDFHLAAAERAEAIQAIVDDPAEPDFENTVVALEAAAQPLKRVMALYSVVGSMGASPEMRGVEERLAPLVGVLDDEITGNAALFARIEAVRAQRHDLGLEPDQARLVELVWSKMASRGAGLGDADRRRLAELNGEIARASARFVQNFSGDEAELYTLFEEEADLDGLDDDMRAAAARLAADKGRPGSWAIPNVRQSALRFLAKARVRGARERVWRLWNSRGENPGERDNRPLMAEILRLRGQKARLLGHVNFAAFQTHDRMARSPEAALDLIKRVWDRVGPATRTHVAELQALAGAEGQSDPLEPWDIYYFDERFRQARLGLDAGEVRQYLTLDGVIDAVLEAASRLHGLAFEPLDGAPLLAPTVRPFVVRRAGEAIGLVYLDIVARESKRRGSWQAEVRQASSFDGRVLPVSTVVTSVDAAPDGRKTVMGWESANVIFHEFGHALHILLNETRYPSLGSVEVPWDMIELPALLNERWLEDPDLLHRHMRHAETGAPMPMDLIEKVLNGLRHDRVFSVNANFLIGAAADLRVHLEADGSDRAIAAVAVESRTRAELGVPQAVDPLLRMPNFIHVFGGEHYAAGVYSYLWADVMAADVAERFLKSEGGLYDAEVASTWRRAILTAGAGAPADDAYLAMMGREPDPDALMRRFGLAQAA